MNHFKLCKILLQTVLISIFLFSFYNCSDDQCSNKSITENNASNGVLGTADDVGTLESGCKAIISGSVDGAGDVDYYKINSGTIKGLFILITWDNSSYILDISIRDTGGTIVGGLDGSGNPIIPGAIHNQSASGQKQILWTFRIQNSTRYVMIQDKSTASGNYTLTLTPF